MFKEPYWKDPGRLINVNTQGGHFTPPRHDISANISQRLRLISIMYMSAGAGHLEAELLTSHLGRVPSRVTSHEGRVRVESRVTEISARVESSHELQGSRVESSRVTQSCRVMPESDIIFNIHYRKRDRMLSVYVEK